MDPFAAAARQALAMESQQPDETPAAARSEQEAPGTLGEASEAAFRMTHEEEAAGLLGDDGGSTTAAEALADLHAQEARAAGGGITAAADLAAKRAEWLEKNRAIARARYRRG